MSLRFRLMPRRWKALGAAATMALLALVPIQMATSQAADPLPPVPVPAGDVTLHMNTDGSYFEYGDSRQDFSGTNRCKYSTGGVPFALLSSTGGDPGYQQKDNGYGLGVNSTNRSSNGCDQTNLGETFTLEFKNDSGPLDGLYVQSADLDMELKYDPTFYVKLFKDGTQVGDELMFDCTASDCGPDSGGGDNKYVHIEGGGVFDAMQFRVTSTNTQASATLEGGNDGTPESKFHMAQLLSPAECNTPIPGSSGDGTDVVVTLTGANCQPKGYSLSVTKREVELITGGGAAGQWVVELDDWAPEEAVNPVPATRVFPPDPGGEDVVWCDGLYDPDDTPDVTPENPSGGGTYGASMPIVGDHSWCLIKQDTAIAGEIEGVQQMQVNEILLLEADARANRG